MVDALVFSPDSRQIAFKAGQGVGEFVVVGGRRGMDGLTRVEAPVFSPDSRTVAYAAKTGARWRVVVGDRRGAEFDWVGAPVFSADGKKVGYGARRKLSLYWLTMPVE